MHATGMAEREPLKLAGNIVQYQCGTIGALAGLAALAVAERQGRAVWVDVVQLRDPGRLHRPAHGLPDVAGDYRGDGARGRAATGWA